MAKLIQTWILEFSWIYYNSLFLYYINGKQYYYIIYVMKNNQWYDWVENHLSHMTFSKTSAYGLWEGSLAWAQQKIMLDIVET